MSIFRTIPYAVLSGSLLVGGGAYAQSMSTIDQRQDYQQDRIEHGIRDGQITSSEARRLEQGERAIDRAQARARADGVVTSQERARIDRMTDRESREIYQQSHDRQQAWDRGQSWGHTDGRNNGWRDNGGRQDGWGRGGDRDGDRGQHNGWARGEHNGWDGNRPPGSEHRDAREDRRFGDRHDSRTVSNTQPGNGSHNWGNGGWQHGSQGGNTTPTGGTQSGNGSHNWGNGGWQHAPQAGNTPPTTPRTGTQPNGGSRNWGNGGSRTQQAANTPPATPSTGTQPNGGSRSWGNNGGFRMQQAAATPQQQAQAPRPTMTRVSSPSPSAGGRSSGGRR